MKYLIYIILLAITTTSCNWLIKPTPNEMALYDDEISKINWDLVDEQAGLLICDSLKTKEDQIICLQQTLQKNIQENLSEAIIKTVDLNVDTIWVALTIYPDSTISLLPDVSSITNHETQEQIKNTLTSTNQNFPKAYPAIKRGIPVKTQFNMPLAFIK